MLNLDISAAPLCSLLCRAYLTFGSDDGESVIDGIVEKHCSEKCNSSRPSTSNRTLQA